MSVTHFSSRLLPLNQRSSFTTIINQLHQHTASKFKPIQINLSNSSSFIEESKEQQDEKTTEMLICSNQTAIGYEKVLKGRLMIEINKAIGRDGINGKLAIEILKRIPSNIQYYESILQSLTSQQICLLVEDMEILIYLFQQLYYLIYRKSPAPQIIAYLKDRASSLNKGFQRLPFLSFYFPHQLGICHALFKHSHDTIASQISDVYFIDKLLSQCRNKEEESDQSGSLPESESYIKQQQKQLLTSLNKIVRTALYNSINRQQISTGIFTAKLIVQVNRQLEKNNLSNSSVIMELLANLSEYNRQLFWKQCYENQQFIETIIIEEIYKVYDVRDLGCRDDNIHTFLEQMNNVKNARIMICNCVYSIIDITIQTKVIELLNKLLIKNKLLLIKVVPFALEKINNIMKKRQSRVYLITLIELFKLLFKCKYPFIQSDMESFIKLIRKSLKQKHSDMLFISFLQLQIEVKKTIESIGREQSKQSKYFQYIYQLMIE